MKSVAQIALVSILQFSTAVGADQVLLYEPNVVDIAGRLSKGCHQHPNGTWFDFYVLTLSSPASIGDDPLNEINNVAEADVEQIQLYSPEPEIREQLEGSLGADVKVMDTLFHSHTAWHVRPLVMQVTAVQRSSRLTMRWSGP